MKSLGLLLLPGLCILAGCVQSDGPKNLSRVSGNPFDCPPAGAQALKPNLPPPTTETAAKVDCVGRKILTCNPKTGLAPLFVTINSPTVEIFFVDVKQVCVTEGLVKKCQCEEELAAILAMELGKMAVYNATKQAYANPDRPPPIALTVGNDRTFDILDPTSYAQLGKYENERRNRPSQLKPQEVAQTFLEKAGYPRNSLDVVQPLLREADQNCALERQFKGQPPR